MFEKSRSPRLVDPRQNYESEVEVEGSMSIFPGEDPPWKPTTRAATVGSSTTKTTPTRVTTTTTIVTVHPTSRPRTVTTTLEPVATTIANTTKPRSSGSSGSSGSSTAQTIATAPKEATSAPIERHKYTNRRANGGSLADGAIAVVSVGAVLALFAIGVLVWYLMHRRARSSGFLPSKERDKGTAAVFELEGDIEWENGRKEN
ncbi:hypothetical protein MKZ38_003793 [Zalerion maritima]|uniref:Uncharacterized protein n=1 Tax=Zalerion maritima TaxID=339359 RepID=A0AAD5WRI3_9PEZI|nr:hypothetical protein MKZ38_003793 [Zalerion maritima]